MKIALSTIGKFHTFDLARELYANNSLAGIFSGYPSFKLQNEGLPNGLIHTFPYVHAPYMASSWKHFLGTKLVRQWERFDSATFESYVAKNLPICDLYVGLSGSSLAAGKIAHQRQVHYVCDRGSSHIRFQDKILREEYDEWGLKFSGVDPRTIAQEEAEYAEADLITVPSSFVLRSFLEHGMDPDRLKLLPYGVNLSRFQPVSKPNQDQFDILFVGGMSLRKGVQYLVQAYQKLNHAKKSLTFVGSPSQDVINLLKARNLWPEDARVLGHIPQTELKSLMSKSHVMVLPSIEEGLALVQAQAMACGCPVIGTFNTGAEDLFDDGEEGYIVPIRNVDALTEHLQVLADDPAKQQELGSNALSRVQKMGGWQRYGEAAMSTYHEIISK